MNRTHAIWTVAIVGYVAVVLLSWFGGYSVGTYDFTPTYDDELASAPESIWYTDDCGEDIEYIKTPQADGVTVWFISYKDGAPENIGYVGVDGAEHLYREVEK